MSNLIPIEKTMGAVEQRFDQLAKIHNAVNYQAEASFALQAIKANNYLKKTAEQNPESLQDAVINVAAIGLTLNPAYKYSYLVPRGGKVCLDISYMGLIQLSCDSGAVKWVQAEIVKEKDVFEFNGVGLRPTHKMNPFGDRGKVVGAYCIAKTEDNEYLTTVMGVEEILEIRNRTEAWKAYESGKVKTCPWVSDESEMIKKTVIKRAYKTWPRNNKAERLYKAMDYINMHEGIDFRKEQDIELASEQQIQNITDLINALGKTQEQFQDYFQRIIGRNFEDITELNTKEAEQAIVQLTQFYETEQAKEAQRQSEVEE